jgi:hypothetical protein
MATQAIRQRYLPPSLPPYLTDVDAHSVHFLALSHGQVRETTWRGKQRVEER